MILPASLPTIRLKALSLADRLTRAIALGTFNAPRLRKLRAYARYARDNANERELSWFLAAYADVIESEIASAERAAVMCHRCLPAALASTEIMEAV